MTREFEGEVQPCRDPFHEIVTPQNTPKRIATSKALAEAAWVEEYLHG